MAVEASAHCQWIRDGIRNEQETVQANPAQRTTTLGWLSSSRKVPAHCLPPAACGNTDPEDPLTEKPVDLFKNDPLWIVLTAEAEVTPRRLRTASVVS